MNMDMLEIAVRSTNARVDRIAAGYVRERHLHDLMAGPYEGTAQIVERLERAVRGSQRALARGHWSADGNRVLALRGALQAERATLTAEGAA
jgi:hypothetical protein